MPHILTFPDIYYDFHSTVDGDTFDFVDIKSDGKTADQTDFNVWQQNFGSDNTSAAELTGSLTLLDPSLNEELGTVELIDRDGDFII